MKDFCILGAGIAGSTIANLLSKKYEVEVFDKARGVGGRSSNRRYKKKLSFDHGAQYISPNSKKFLKFLFELEKNKVVKKWNGNHLNFSFKNKNQKLKFIGKKGNSDISKYLLRNVKTYTSSAIIKIYYNDKFWTIFLDNKKKFEFKRLIITSPFPQTKILAKKYLNKKKFNIKVKMEPNITVMIVLKNSMEVPISSILFKDQILGWAANENSKNRFKSKNNLWTLQANTTWSKKFINNYKLKKKFITNLIINRFCNLTGFKKKQIVFKDIHGWKYSYNSAKTKNKSYFDKRNKLGVCGDWMSGARIEDAWISANNLFKKLKNS